MKKTLVGMVAALGACVMLSGCLVAPVVPPVGIIYTDFKAPLDYNASGETVGTRSGEAETMSILALVALGDASIKTAAQNGGITQIHSIDYHYTNIVGVYQKYVTIVHGE